MLPLDNSQYSRALPTSFRGEAILSLLEPKRCLFGVINTHGRHEIPSTSVEANVLRLNQASADRVPNQVRRGF
jgi:hypothetical protein